MEAATSSAWDLLLIGFRLPLMDGPAAVRMIREREEPSGRRLPIIALMSDPGAAEMAACLSAGMEGYLTRPLDSGQLWNTLQRWLKPVPGTASAVPAEVSPEPPPPKEPEAMFDLEPVLLQHDRDMGFIRELVDIFLADTPAGLRDIKIALQRDDLARAERIAHGMKGACANFGVAPLADIFSEIETHSRDGQPDAALKAHSRAAHPYAAVEIALEKLES